MANFDDITRNKVLSHLKIINTWASVDEHYGGIGPECCDDIAQWTEEAINLIESLFTPNDAMLTLIHAGQCDKRFKIGDTIRYTPSETCSILMEGKRKP